jgi:hypothetical protein
MLDVVFFFLDWFCFYFILFRGGYSRMVLGRVRKCDILIQFYLEREARRES